jgi:hypothetical protein
MEKKVDINMPFMTLVVKTRSTENVNEFDDVVVNIEDGVKEVVADRNTMLVWGTDKQKEVLRSLLN